MTDGWVVEAREASPALGKDFRPEPFAPDEDQASIDTFEAEPYDPKLPFEHDHIDSWNSFGELLGPEGVKRLMRAVQ
jgi:hypothetical protein